MARKGSDNIGTIAVIALVAFAIAMIPFMLGLLVAVPVLFASWLISYQDVFGVDAAPQN